MAQIVKLRRSSVSGQKPTNTNLQLGELALNTTDGKVYMAKSGSLGPSVEELISTNTVNTGSINLIGDITGSNISSSFIGDGSRLYNIPLSGVTNLTTISGSIDNRLDVLEAYSGSQLVPSSSMSFRTLQTDVYCKNMSGTQINKGTVVRIVGAVGDNPLIGVASPLTEGQSANTLGIATENIPNDSFGLVITEGILFGVNTDGMNAGQLIFLGENGTFTTSYPVAPNHGVRLGEVLRTQQNAGSIYVRIDNGSELGEAHNVVDTTTNSSYGDLLVKSGSVWKNSRNLNGNYAVTGSLTITQNLTVLGSSSFVYVTSSNLAVSASFISVNVFEPAERFGGLKVYDSGSSNATASLAWDSLHNHWVYQNVSGSSYSGGMLLAGPRNSGSLGDEPNLINGRIVKSVGGDHIDVSIISETGTTITVAGDLVANSITGAFDFYGLVNRPTLVSGSSQINITGTTGYSTFSGSLSSSIGSLSSSVATTTLNLKNRVDSIEGITGSISSLNIYTGSNNTVIGTLQTATSSLNSYTSSNTTNINAIHTSTSSLNTFTSSASGRLTSIEGITGSISSLNTYTGSNNTVIGTLQTATSSLNSYTSSNTTNINAIHTSTGSFKSFTSSFDTAFGMNGADVTIKGNLTVSGTQTIINSTTVAIGDNIIQLNGTGATNAGLIVRDSTAPNIVSGSLLWDSTNDKWIAGSFGSEDDIVLRTATQTLTNKTINASQLVDASVTNTKLANSSITIAGTSTSLGGTISAATILSGTGTVSGSSQILHDSTTGYVANRHIDHTGVSISAGSGLSGGGDISATRTVTLDTGSVHFLDGVKKELNTEGVISGSSQILNGTTNYVAKFTSSSTVGNGIIFDNGTNVGIGTTSQSEKLTIGTGDVNHKILIRGTVADVEFGNDTIGLKIGTANNGNIYFTTNAAERLRISNLGNVGIGTTSPSSLLTLKTPTADPVAIRILQSSHGTTKQALIQITDDPTTTAYVTHKWDLNSTNYDINTSGSFSLGTANANRMNILADGKVLINTTSSSGTSIFQVNGSIRQITALSQIVYATANGDLRGASGAEIATALGTAASGNYIQNQNAAAQTANAWVSGILAFGGSLNLNNVGVIYGNATDVYGNFRVLSNQSSSLQDGMYINYNSTGSSAAHLRFYANGTNERMTIRADTGNVGIGTTNPQVKFDVVGAIKTSRLGHYGTYSSSEVQGIWSISNDFPISTANNDFGIAYGLSYAYVSAGVGTSKKPLAGFEHQLLLTESGNVGTSFGLSGLAYFGNMVGIGVNPTVLTAGSSHYKKLTIVGGHSDTVISLHSTGNNTNATSSTLTMWASEPNITYTGAGIGHNINTHLMWGRVNTSIGQAYIRFDDGNTSFINTSTQNTDGTLPQMYISRTGNVGIGAVTPTERVHVDGNVKINNGYSSFYGDSANANGFKIGVDSGTNTAYINQINNSSLTIKTNNTTAIHIHNTQNVGIGTTTDASYKLDVNGTVRISSTLTTSGSILPSVNNTYNLGSASFRWANVYTNDLHLSNMNKPEGNDIDGTKGTWTIQEGVENLYIINNNNGKKYKIDLTEII